jgi:hypothetical protein
MSLTNRNLIENVNKYDIDILEKNVKNLNKKALLFTQKLTAEFCIKYLFNPDIDSGSEDSYIFDKIYILEHQEHITEEEFDEAFHRRSIQENMVKMK